MKKEKLFHKDFTLMVIGQIISLFGNGIVRYALPVYLYSMTGSATLLGIVSAVSFIPMVLLSPVGGIIADRVNKRNIMVALDFTTALITIACMLLLGGVSLVPLIMVVMLLLYAIAGAYQPAVQASIPAMCSEKNIMPANAVINQISSLAGLIGPVLGGILYAAYGLVPILVVGAVCFFLSAVMEISIHIPFTRQPSAGSVLQTVKQDLGQGANFIRKEKPFAARITLIIAAFNLFMSSMLMVGMLVIIKSYLGFDEATGDLLYGYNQGIMMAGGLAGGIFAGVMASKLKLSSTFPLLIGSSLVIAPMAIAVLPGIPPMVSYVAISALCFFGMALATVFSVQMLSFVQRITPDHLIGKVISVVMAICMCAQPAGQAMYGVLFDHLAPHYVLLFAAVASVIVSLIGRKTFTQLASDEKKGLFDKTPAAAAA